MHRIAVLAAATLALLAVAIQPAFGAAKKPLKPTLGRTILLKPAGGTVIVKQRGQRQFKLRKPTIVKVGSKVDTTKGKVKLSSARKSSGTQSGTFSQGAFLVTQQKSDGLTDLALTGGDFGVCSAAHAAGTHLTAAANKRRRLFGNAHGRFRTRGRNSSATVRGTEWLTEDRCTGTVTENKSPNTTSKVSTETRDRIHFDLDPGQTITYYCNKYRIEPDTYCIVLLAYPNLGIVAGGIVTQVDVETYRLCLAAPSGDVGCFPDALPLTQDDAQSFRQGVFACPVRQTGKFEFGWSLDGQTVLFPTLTATLNVQGPNENCQTDPPTPQPIAKG